jgi:hypothetical protein
MKKLVKVVLAHNDTGVLFSLDESVSGRLDANGAFSIIEQDSYSELMRGDGVNGREGVIAYIPNTKYEELKKKGEID